VSFHDFLGNEATVRHLREAVAAERIPPALILSGARGAGKFTLALMLAQTINCLVQPTTDGLPDFCGTCANCLRIASAQPLEERVAEAVAAREDLREVDKKETRILIQPHPDLLVIPPDPPQLLIKLGQVRSVIRGIYRVPAEARRAIYIFTSSAFMKEAANSLLKILEEPPSMNCCRPSVHAPPSSAWARCRRHRFKPSSPSGDKTFVRSSKRCSRGLPKALSDAR
jgi:DNA polymerase-3 subunit delta'